MLAQDRRLSKVNQATAGFTLIEVLVVVIIIAVLMSIAAPGWLAFANRQRVNTVRDGVLQTLRQAQSQATQRRDRQTVSIVDDPNLPPSLAVNGGIVNLGSQEIDPGTVTIEAFSLVGNDWTPTNDDIVFNYQGALDGDQLFQIRVSPATGGDVRCVVLTTLLGSMQTFNGEECTENTDFN
jgi:prepilin-type N-terminal cleavage/methylation domain-containing protein